MSKEMKCRGWHNERKVMIPWEQMKFQKDEDDHEIVYFEDDDGDGVFWTGGADLNVTWFTGQRDHNGIDVYEGDILKVFPEDDYYPVSLFLVHSHMSLWGRRYSWEPLSGYDCSTHIVDADEERENLLNVLIVGNAFERPEFLEGLMNEGVKK